MAGRRLGAVCAALGLALSAITVVAARPAAAASPAEGDVLSFGDAVAAVGSAGEDAVDVAGTPSGMGWFSGDPAGVVHVGGDAVHRGDLAATALNKPIVGTTATPSGGGYWLVATDGGIFAFGDAPFLGSTGAMRLNQPIVAMAATPSGRGYWLVAADGGVFTLRGAPLARSA